jgi:putative transposase
LCKNRQRNRAKCKLTPAQLRNLEAGLDAGPAASGWDEDQRWMLARIADVIWRWFSCGP